MAAISLYKHPNARKGQYCAICLDRTRGPAQLVRLGYGVIVHLCAQHASPAFQTQRLGRDFVLTLHRAWSAGGCLTRRRSRALDAHLGAISRAASSGGRREPGSYAWPELRDEVEQRSARGEPPETIVADLRRRRAPGFAVAPSVRTIRRWIQERRWILRRALPRRTPPPASPRAVLAGAELGPAPSPPRADTGGANAGRSPPDDG